MTAPSESAAPQEKSRLTRALARAGAAAGLGAVFLAALAAGALLHLDIPPARRTIEGFVQASLEGSLEGSIEIRGVQRFDLDGVTVDSVVIHDPNGAEVLRARGVRLDASLLAIARSAAGDGDLVITLGSAHVDEMEARVESDPQGDLTIVRAFTPRATGSSEPGRPVRFQLDHLQIATIVARGKPDGVHPIDAELRDLAGNIRVGPGSLEVDLAPVELAEHAALPVPLSGVVELHLRVTGPATPSDKTPDVTHLWGSFAGRAGKIDLVAKADLNGDHIVITADAPAVRPEDARAILRSYPVNDLVSAHVEARGDLPNIDFRVAVQTDRSGSLGASGRVHAAAPLRGEASFRTTELDLRSADPSLPDIRVTSAGRVRADLGDPVSVRVEAQTEPTRLGDAPIPAAEATAEFNGEQWTGSASVHEPGAPLTATFATEEGGAVRFDATTKIPSLAAVPRIPAKLRGAAEIHASGAVRDGHLDARLTGRVQGFRAGSDARIDRAAVTGRVQGPLADLRVDASVSARGAAFAGYALDTATVRASGPITRPIVNVRAVAEQDTRVEVSAALDPRASAAHDLTLHLERGGASISGTIAEIRPGEGGLRIRGIALQGPEIGAVTGSLRVVGGELAGALHADRMSLSAARALLGIDAPMEGFASADIALTPTRLGRDGHLQLSLSDARIGAAQHITGDLQVNFDDDHVTGGATIALGATGGACDHPIATLRLTGADAHIRGKLLDPRTFRSATGRVTVAADDWDLACLRPLLPVELPLSELSGILSAKMTLSRETADAVPSIRDLSARSYYLTVAGPLAPQSPPSATSGAVEPAPSWDSRDIDFELQGDVDGDTGHTNLSVSLFDHERLADISLGTTLDFPALLDPLRRASALRAAPIAGMVAVPRRDLTGFRALPAIIRAQIPPITGDARLWAFFSGSLERPSAVVRVMAQDVAKGPDDAGTSNRWALPIDVDAAAWFTSGAHLGLDAHLTRDRRELATATAALTAPLERLLADKPDGPLLTGRAAVTLWDLPLSDIPAFTEREIRGHLHGKIALEGLGTAPSFSVDLSSNDLGVGPELTFQEARFQFATRRAEGADETTAVALARLHDRAGGRLDATGYVSLGWENGVVPTPVRARPADFRARLHRFRLAAIEPLLGGDLRKISGLLDGDVRIGWGRSSDTDQGALQTDLRLTGASFYIPRMGQEVRLAGERGGPVRIAADHTGALHLLPLIATAGSGKLRARADAKLDGLHLASAHADLKIADGEALPITFEGVAIGEAWGTLAVDATNTPKRLAIDVRSSDLHLKIPTSTTRDVQPLDANPDITLSHPLRPPQDPSTPGDRTIALTARLENMTIEGKGVHIVLSSVPASPPQILINDTSRGAGDIRVVRGTVEVMGRKFELEQGAVHLREEELTNPYLSVTAHWDAPDSSRIFVDYVGVLNPITREKLRVRSNPPRTQQEALAVLLFGSETGGALTTGTPTGVSFGSAATEAAVGLGGELATQQFNQLLSGIAPLKGLSTRFATTEGGGMKTSLVYQVGDTVSAAATYSGALPTSSNSTAAPGASVSVDWRFVKNWLIRATLGTSADVPSGEVDLLWQYRY